MLKEKYLPLDRCFQRWLTSQVFTYLVGKLSFKFSAFSFNLISKAWKFNWEFVILAIDYFFFLRFLNKLQIVKYEFKTPGFVRSTLYDLHDTMSRFRSSHVFQRITVQKHFSKLTRSTSTGILFLIKFQDYKLQYSWERDSSTDILQ